MINVKIICCNHFILTFKNHNMHTVNLFGAKKLNASWKGRGGRVGELLTTVCEKYMISRTLTSTTYQL